MPLFLPSAAPMYDAPTVHSRDPRNKDPSLLSSVPFALVISTQISPLSSKGPRPSGFPQSTMDNLWSLFINCPIKCSVHLLFIDMVEGVGWGVCNLKAR